MCPGVAHQFLVRQPTEQKTLFRVNLVHMNKITTRQYEMKSRAVAAEATGEAILDAGMDAFGTRRYHDVTLQDMAAAAGVSVQTVMRRFGSKEGLFDAVVVRERKRIAHRREVPAGSDIDDAVAVLVQHYEDDGLTVLHFLSEEVGSSRIAGVVEEGRAVHRAWVEAYLGEVFAGKVGAERQCVVDAAVVTTDLYSWKLLRIDAGRSEADVVAVMVSMLRAIERGME